MDNPLTIWYCDGCGTAIKEMEQGVVGWRTNSDLKVYHLQVLHKKDCLASSASDQWRSLNAFPGIDGLSYILGWLSQGPINQNLGREMYCSVADLDEYADLLRRLYIPHYEEARLHFKDKRVLDHHQHSDEYSPYTVEQFMRLFDLVEPEDVPSILLQRPKPDTLSEWLPLSDR